MNPLFVPLAAFLIAACATDLSARRIPNWLNLAAALTGLTVSTLAAGTSGALDSLMGMGVGLLMLLPFFVARVLGAGDVKMLAAVGSFAGPAGVFMCGLYAMIAGGLLAMAALLAGRRRRLAIDNLRTMATGLLLRLQGTSGPQTDLRTDSAARLPYAVALAAGTFAWMYLQSRTR